MSEARRILHQMALEAATGANGSIAVAEGRLDTFIREQNSAELERELCIAYRGAALLAAISQAFAELRAATFHEPPEQLNEAHPAAQLALPKPTPQRPPQGLLDTFLVNGQPIGSLTPEELEPAAAARERDARFIRLLISGIPPRSPVRQHKTADDAKACYEIAASPEPPDSGPSPTSQRSRRRRPTRDRQNPTRQPRSQRTRRSTTDQINPTAFAARPQTSSSRPQEPPAAPDAPARTRADTHHPAQLAAPPPGARSQPAPHTEMPPLRAATATAMFCHNRVSSEPFLTNFFRRLNATVARDFSPPAQKVPGDLSQNGEICASLARGAALRAVVRGSLRTRGRPRAYQPAVLRPVCRIRVIMERRALSS